MKFQQHSGYVQGPITGGPQKGWFFGVCANCGWQGLNNRETREQAEQDVANHVATTGVEVRVDE